MHKTFLAAGVAALAFAAPAIAQDHGKGHGGGHGNGKGGHTPARMHTEKGHGNGKAHAEVRGQKDPMRVSKGHGDDHRDAKAAHAVRVDRVVNGNRDVRRVELDDRDDGRLFPRLAGNGKGLIEGCPPGLAMKNNGCMPPGQLKKVGSPYDAALRGAALTGPYSQWYGDNDRYMYRMGDGVIYQVNRSTNLIDALIPYGMRDYSYYPVGYAYPQMYNSYNVPLMYQGYYPQGGDYLYRYGGNAIYALDPKTQMVSSIVSLLAGDLSVGQRLPTAYSVYNMPLAYRDQYADTANDWYRYNDGYIYRVDPTTQLITAVINALV